MGSYDAAPMSQQDERPVPAVIGLGLSALAVSAVVGAAVFWASTDAAELIIDNTTRADLPYVLDDETGTVATGTVAAGTVVRITLAPGEHRVDVSGQRGRFTVADGGATSWLFRVGGGRVWVLDAQYAAEGDETALLGTTAHEVTEPLEDLFVEHVAGIDEDIPCTADGRGRAVYLCHERDGAPACRCGTSCAAICAGAFAH